VTALSFGSGFLEKQPVPTECFEDAFLEYLRVRFEFEPLPHYAMAAMHLCHEVSRDYPDFVRAFFAWFAESFLFDMNGKFPAQSHNADPADHRWRRFADCHDLLEGWLNDDLKGALEAQAERLELIEEVERLRNTERDDPAGKQHRTRLKKTMTDGEVFEKLEEWFGDRSHKLRRQYKKMTEPKLFMSGIAPIALVHRDGKYHTEFRRVAPPGAISIPLGKNSRKKSPREK